MELENSWDIWGYQKEKKKTESTDDAIAKNVSMWGNKTDGEHT